MKSRVLDLSPEKMALVLGVLLVVLGAAAWLILVSPNRDKASSLSSTIKSEQSALKHKLSSSHAQTSKRTAQKHAVSQALLTARALPNTTGIPQIVLQLSRIATEEKVTLNSISPQAPIAYSGYSAVPLSITLTGDYFSVQNFLQQLLKQVTTSTDGVRATGRLYDVLNVTLSPTTPPQLTATITLDAFTYSPVIPTAAPTATTTTTGSGLG